MRRTAPFRRAIALGPASRAFATLAIFMALAAGLSLLFVAASRESEATDLGDAVIWAGLFVAVIAPIVWRGWRGRLDLFEPLIPTTVAFIGLFLLRPAYDIATDRRTLADVIDVSSNYREALLMTLLGVIAFQIGYSLSRCDADRSAASPRYVGDRALVVGGLLLSSLSVVVLIAK